jgi:hypothetical protein
VDASEFSRGDTTDLNSTRKTQSEARLKIRKTPTLQLLNHLDAAYHLARWLTQNEDDVEDMVQGTPATGQAICRCWAASKSEGRSEQTALKPASRFNYASR